MDEKILSNDELNMVSGGSRSGAEAQVGDWVVHRSQKPNEHIVYEVLARNGNYLTLLRCSIDLFYDEFELPPSIDYVYLIVDKPSWIPR